MAEPESTTTFDATDAAASGATAPVVIKVREHGPLLVTGPVSLVDHRGMAFVLDGPNVALCRCGASARKPLCDGTHRGLAFDGTCSAPMVPAAETKA